ncbi:MAG TPA: isochorismate synthase [Actinomycetota bacterium]|nr:isochorismate synthase [Actinomycetota bacterium]
MSTRAALAVRAHASQDIDLLDLAARLEKPIVWLNGGDGMVAAGEAARIDAGSGDDRFPRAAAALREVFAGMDVAPEARAVAFGSFAFDPASDDSVLVVPAVVWGRRGGRSWVTTIGDTDPASLLRPRSPGSAARVRYGGSTISELAWLDAVAAAVERIRSGKAQKTVLARDVLVWSKEPFDVPLLLRRLAGRFPGCFTFSCDGLIGATPELLVSRAWERVRSIVLAGTVARGDEAAADESLARGLMTSEKDLAEHAFAADSVADPLRTVCADLVVEGPTLLRLANAQHLSTRVEGRLTTGATALDLAGMLHPTAAVCGTPRAEAMQLIRDLEGMGRGRYSGPVGWVDSAGDGEWGIALRCGEFEGTRGRLFAGNGIVAASEPEDELEETRVKLRAMMSALERA